MATRKSQTFLPEVFKTERNRKFLNATLDQLISEPRDARFDGFIGRKFANNYTAGDGYLSEISTDRTNYQLEPGVVYRNSEGTVESASSYIDFLNNIRYYNGNTENPNDLFSQEYYNWSGFVDLDKLVNYGEYFWLPGGPDRVNVFGNTVDMTEDYTVYREGTTYSQIPWDTVGYDSTTFDEETSQVVTGQPVYRFNNTTATSNETLYLARGGTYTFNVSQPGIPFWIQTEIGLTGISSAQQNVSTRDVVGVSNNGEDVGRITFNVPMKDDQSFFTEMTTAASVDFCSTLSYSQIHNQVYSKFVDTYGGIDTFTEINGKTLVFLNDSEDETLWDAGSPFDGYPFSQAGTTFDATTRISLSQRYDVYAIALKDIGGTQTITLTRTTAVPQGQKVTIKQGKTYGNRQLWKNTSNKFELIPPLTSLADELYYQDGVDSTRFGRIVLIDDGKSSIIDVVNDVLGKENYTSPNGVIFTNGLKIEFDTTVTPTSYQNETYYVEGVGSSITLTLAKSLTTPEPFTETLEEPYDSVVFDSTNYDGSSNSPVLQDYIVANRSCVDNNAWARGNRWFHRQVIEATAKYNKFTPAVDDTARAKRPIIEFTPNLSLFNYGVYSIDPVSVVDVTETDALSNVNGQTGYFSDSIDLLPQMTVIFTADPDLKNKIFRVDFIDEDANANTRKIINLVQIGTVPNDSNVTSILGAKNQGVVFYYKNSTWLRAQQKTKINQEPLFDVFDGNHKSFGDTSVYPSSTFSGCKLFSYKRNSNAATDQVLEFGLTYNNFENIGDIVFENNYIKDTFTYVKNTGLTKVIVRSGHVHYIDKKTNKRSLLNGWTQVLEDSKQFQIVTYTVASELYTFEIGAKPKDTVTSSLQVFVNSNFISNNQYSILNQNEKYYVVFKKSLTKNDVVTLRVFSDTIIENGYFEIPKNIENNANNDDFENLSLGQIRNHLIIITNNIKEFEGSSLGSNNIRDLNYRVYPGKILQHSAGAILGQYLITSDEANIIDSLIYSMEEYTRFKNRFIENIDKLDLDYRNITKCVDDILLFMVNNKTVSFPFYYSDMVPWGNTFSTVNLTVDDIKERVYEFGSQFDLTSISQRAVIIYHIRNNVKTQLLEGVDYTFDTINAAFILNDRFVTFLNDKFEIREYTNTDGSFVPPTPTKLGLWKKYTPRKYIDNTYSVPKEVLQGHDGSIWATYGDIRDDVILEFEKRVYNNIKTQFRNDLFDFDSVLSGYWRPNSSVSLSRELSIIRSLYGKWAIKNRVDTVENTTWNETNQFSWNHTNGTTKLEGRRVPGFWRGIYKWFYDTDTPHLTPWEMLGHSQKPSWWDDRYGVAPYTRGNNILWEDIRDGKVYSSAVTDTYTVNNNYKKPELLDYIPVDDQGRLRSPTEFLIKDVTSANSDDAWRFGDYSPQETAWRRSSEWPFAIQIISAIKKPAKYLSLMFDTGLYSKQTEYSQILKTDKSYRPKLGDFYIHGVAKENTTEVNRVEGYNQFIYNYIVNRGLSIADTQTRIRNLTLNLMYQLSGFSDKKYLKIISEQATPSSSNKTIFLPDENYNLIMHKSNPLERVIYSGVKISIVHGGYKITGYDIENPFFRIVPSVRGTDTTTVTVGNQSIKIFKNFMDAYADVPYGTVLKSKGQVADFLNAYQRYLNAKGMKFESVTEKGEPKDFILGAREFLFWTDQNWPIGSVLAISPAYDYLEIERPFTTTDDFSKSNTLKDQNSVSIRKSNYNVSRIDNQTTITVNTDQNVLYSANVSPIQYEHYVVLDNKTIFNDIVYQPELGNRQDRVKLVGFKAGQWNGTLHAPGYIFNDNKFEIWQQNKDYKKGDYVSFRDKVYAAKVNHGGKTVFDYNDWVVNEYMTNGLLPNIATKAESFNEFFDVNKMNLEVGTSKAAKGLIGFRSRGYLENLGLDDVSQVKFYQGLLKTKGTQESINKLVKANLTNVDQEINFYEEWGFRVGEFGSIDSNQVISFIVKESKTDNNPVIIELLADSTQKNNQDYISLLKKDLLTVPNEYSNKFLNVRSAYTPNSDLTSAGYPRLDDIDFTVWASTDLKNLNQSINKIGRGKKIWIARNPGDETVSPDWTVYRVSETTVEITSAVSSTNGFITFKTSGNHGFKLSQQVLIKTTDVYSGFYQIDSIPSPNSFVVKSDIEIERQQLRDPVFKLTRSRFSSLSDITSSTPAFGWNKNELVWIDDDSNSKWAVYKKDEPWAKQTFKTLNSKIGNAYLGHSIAIGNQGLTAASGAPNDGTGSATFFAIDESISFIETGIITLSDKSGLVDDFGTGLGLGGSYGAVGAPSSNSSKGYVTVFKNQGAGSYIQTQAISINGIASGAQFGTQIKISKDDRYMFVSAPGTNTVYVYALNDIATNKNSIDNISGDGITATFTLNFTPLSVNSIYLQDNLGKTYFPYLDYTLSGNNITFTSIPANGLKVVVRQETHYQLIETITGSDSMSGDRFGESIDIDNSGRTLVVGAPYAEVANSASTVYQDAGEAYVFNMTVEAFSCNGTTKSFTTETNLPGKFYVEVDGVLQTLTSITDPDDGDGSSINYYSVSSNTITFRYTPTAGSTVRIFTGTYKEVQKIDQNLTDQAPSDSENFGRSVAIDAYGSIIAIGAPGEDELNPNTGSVFLFADSGMKFGNITTESGFSVTSGDTIYVDDFKVTMSSTSNDQAKLVSDIANANIVNISTSLVGSNAYISSANNTTNRLMRIRPGVGSSFKTSKITPFRLVQKINHPAGFENENFGTAIAFNKFENNGYLSLQELVITSDVASTLSRTRFDLDNDTTSVNYGKYLTTFDSDSTTFIDRKTQSGAVYTFEQLLPSGTASITNPFKYGFIQQLQSDDISYLDQFGYSVAYMDSKLFVGSRLDDTSAVNSGTVYEFVNPLRKKGWQLYRNEVEKVDIGLINRTILYDRSNDIVTNFLDYIDPYKGKLVGQAEAEINYMTPYDPAAYTTSPDNSSGRSWDNEYIGKVWWDLQTCSIIEYEQGDIDYRANHWGQFFPGSSIDVYEWVESDVLPSEYIAAGYEGTPKHEDDTYYSLTQQYNTATNSTTTKYYFWVKGKLSVPEADFRNISIQSVANLIADPKGQGIKFVSFLSQSALSLTNVKENISGDNTVLSINYDVVPNEGILHSEFDIVSEGDSAQKIPSKIWNKLVDSMAGTDAAGSIIPDPTLNEFNRYGIFIRPRQTLLKNRRMAIKIAVDYCNDVFKTIPIVRQSPLTGLFSSQLQPTSQSGEWDKKVNNIVERDYLNVNTLSTGYNVLVDKDESLDNNWTIYTLKADKTWFLTKVQSFTTSGYWSYKTWYAEGYNQTTIPHYQVKTEPELLTLDASVGQTAKVLTNDDGNFSFFEYTRSNTWKEVIIENGTVELNSSLYTFSTSDFTRNVGFDDDIFDFRYYDNVPFTEIRSILTAIKDEIFVDDLSIHLNKLFFRLIEYVLSEDTGITDWIFKTSFLKVIHKLRNLNQYPTYKSDNSQFIESYINEVKPYKTKIREYITKFNGTDTFGGDITDFDVHAFYDEKLQYFRKPSGDYSGDEILQKQGLNKPWNDNYSLRVSSLVILNQGTGYIIDPSITISAPDLPGGVTATARARTNSDKIIEVILLENGSGYTRTPTITITGAGTGCIIAPRMENITSREFDITIKFDRITYSSIVKDWTANTTYSYEDIISYKNNTSGEQEVYKCIVTGGFTSGSTFSTEISNGTTVLEVYSDELLASNADRIAAYYAPTSGMLGDDLNLLQLGTDYTGNRVTGAGFDLEPGFDQGNFDTIGYDDFDIDTDGLTVLSGTSSLDTIIRGTFADLALGTRPEDINIDGGKFVDVYNSHAPEEVIPGIIFDTLDMEVYTDPSNDFEYDGNSFEVISKSYSADGSTKTFSFASSQAKEDVDFIRVWVGATPQRNLTLDYFDRTVTLENTPAAGSAVYIYGFGVTGEKMSHEETFIGDGSTAGFVSGIPIANADQQLVLKNGIRLVKGIDYTVNDSDNKVLLQFTDVPANSDHIHVFMYDQDESRQAWTEVYTQEITLVSGTKTYDLEKTIQYTQPFEGNVVVELGNLRLRPSNAKHYVADGSTLVYSIPTTAGELPTLADGDIRVTVISPDDRSTLNPVTNKTPNIDYFVNPSDGSSVRTIEFFNPPSTGDTVIVSVRTGDYQIDGNIITLDDTVSFSNGDKLYVTSFANHNPLRIQTKVFEGLGSEIVSSEVGFDDVIFDSSGFDGTAISGLSTFEYTMDRNITNTNYLWVTLNGVKLHAGEYTIVGNNKVSLSGQSVTSNSIIVITSFSENVIQPTVGFRILNNMLGEWEYRRLAKDFRTELATDLLPTDTKIYVQDATKLPLARVNDKQPGVVYIGAERVTYWEISYEDNYITNFRRGTSGTSFFPIHRKMTPVIDGSLAQELPDTSTHTKVWYTQGSTTAANGLGLQSSSTINANFLKDKEATVGNYLRELDSPRYIAADYVEEDYVEIRE